MTPHELKRRRGSNSVVECNLAKVEVVGSNPISRSRIISELNLSTLEGYSKVLFVFAAGVSHDRLSSR